LALYLAAAGVGRLTVIDFDTVDDSNLQRQILYTTAQVGRPKAEAAAERLLALNPYIEVKAVKERLSAANALALFRDHDVVADGADNFATRYLSNDASVLADRPLVSASILGFEGQLSVFHYRDGPCFRCLYPEPPPAGLVPSCAENGVLGVLPGVMGALQATEVLKLLLGLGEPLSGRLLYFDALRMDFQKMEIHRNEDCAVCGRIPTITCLKASAETCETAVDHIEVEELRDSRASVFLLDVREPLEAGICQIEGAHLIPLKELEMRLGEIPAGQNIVAYCKGGVRSEGAVRLLAARGIRARSLRGGILAWIEKVDSGMQKY
jgi:adenylyltransferase/sulfurtransferase